MKKTGNQTMSIAYGEHGVAESQPLGARLPTQWALSSVPDTLRPVWLENTRALVHTWKNTLCYLFMAG